MRKLLAVSLAIIMSACAVGCKYGEEHIRFHEETFKRADLSTETLEWLEWYNELTEDEQLAISYIPGEIHSILYGEVQEGMEEVVEAGN